MTLTVEDGTGVDGADSFNTVAECTAHAIALFGESLSGSDAMKESALRRAFVYMGGLNWKPEYPWPTLGGTIPEPVKKAQSVFARAEFKNVGYLSPEVTTRFSKVLNQVGELGWDVQHGPNTADAARPVVTMAFDLLGPYLASEPGAGSRTAFLKRA